MPNRLRWLAHQRVICLVSREALAAGDCHKARTESMVLDRRDSLPAGA